MGRYNSKQQKKTSDNSQQQKDSDKCESNNKGQKEDQNENASKRNGSNQSGSKRYTNRSHNRRSNSNRDRRRQDDSNKSDKRKEENQSRKDESPLENSWEYYAITEEIARQIASFPYNKIPGRNRNFDLQVWNSTTNATANIGNIAPSVLVMDVINSMAHTEGNTDGINIAARQLYTYVRHANSGAKNYESPDLMMYIKAMEDIYSDAFEIRRALGLVGCYDYVNTNLPETLFKAINVNSAAARSNYANSAARFNILLSQINSLAVPKYFKAFERRAYIYLNVFMDSDAIRGQFLVHVRRGGYTWTPRAQTTGSSLTYSDYESGEMSDATPIRTIDDMLTVLETKVQAVISDEDVGTMSGDILKAFGDSNLFQLLPYALDYKTSFLFDENILAQVENAVPVTAYTGGSTGVEINFGSSLNITQSPDTAGLTSDIVYKPTISVVPQGVFLKNFMLNSHKKDPDFRDNLEWTRLMMAASLNYSGATTQMEFWPGLELLVSIKSVRISDVNESEVRYVQTRIDTVLIGVSNATRAQALNAYTEIMNFDWHPFLYVVTMSGNTPTRLIIGGDDKVSTTIATEQIKALNDSASAAAYYATDLYKRASPTK